MIVIEVSGKPAPQGSKRHVGGGRMIEMSKAVGPWREAVRAETQRVMHGHGILGGAVRCTVIFRMPRPAGHYGTGRNATRIRPGAPHWPAGKPDLDKLARAVLDGLTSGGAWKDDSQVIIMNVRKIYAVADLPPGCRIELSQLTPDFADARATTGAGTL
jgi:crossover junction endodeoxyribonuclease RusA